MSQTETSVTLHVEAKDLRRMAETVTMNPDTADKLRGIVQEVMRLKAEASAISAEAADVLKAAKSDGFDTAAIKRVATDLMKEADKRQQDRSMYDFYMDICDPQGQFDFGAGESPQKAA